MPIPSRPIRGPSTPIRKEKTGLRRASDQPSMLTHLPSDPSTLSDRRRRIPQRASKEMRSNSLPQGFPSTMADSPPSGDSPEPADDAPRTKTGRISTAKKGKPVHKCEDCGKVYTRNEHLKRHQLNHSTKSMPCDEPRCKQRFKRSDLLERHKREDHYRHSIPGMPLDTTGILPSEMGHIDDTASDPEHRRPSGSLQPSTASFLDGSSLSPSPHISNMPFETDFNHMGPFYPNYSIGEGNDVFPFQTPSFGDGFGTHNYDFSGSHSPASVSSVNIWSQYSDTRRGSRNLFSPTTTDSHSPFSTPFQNVGQAEFANPSTNYYEAQDRCEETIITKDLSNIISAQDNYGFQPHLTNLDPRYIDAYWRHFDPLFSIVNPFTFEVSGSSPLVKALMIAIGAYHFDDHAAQTVALTLRETCSKLFHDRLVLDYHHSRLWDLQAIFLFEAFSVYCSRRPHSRFSQRFEELLQDLRSDRDNAFYSTPLSIVDATTATFGGVADSAQRLQWVHLESKRRLLLACYALEVQQNLFFGSHRPVSDKNLPMPCSKGLWDAKTFEEWQYLVQQETADPRPLSDVMTNCQSGEASFYDSFLSNIAIVHVADNAMSDPTNAQQLTPPSTILSPAKFFAAEAASLAIHTPIQHLLGVSGETFVLGQKLATRDQFHEAYGELHNWVASGNAIPAIRLAVQLFSMSLQHERVGLIYEDWAMTLAALVLWASIMWPQQSQVQGSLSQPPAHGVVELATKVISAASEQPEYVWREGRGMSWCSARACLAYARQRIDGRIGWLTQDASGVLGKLIEGRAVDDTSMSEDTV